LRPQHVLFSYLHLAANAELADALGRIGLTALAFETVEVDGKLPLLAPMSHIAGRLAVQIAAQLLQLPQGGRGLLLGGLPRAERGRVVVLGAGAAGGDAAAMAAAMGAEVTVFDRKSEALERMFALGPNVTALTAYQAAIAEAVAQADVLIGAVLIPGARAPYLVTRPMVQTMKRGAVIIDIAIDQGGCIETMRPTDYSAPTYIDEGVVHFGVTNMPGAVPRTASQALSAAILPFVQRLAEQGPQDPLLQGGLNIAGGRVVHPAVAQTLAKRA
jgi:alanine dehydrogenase